MPTLLELLSDTSQWGNKKAIYSIPVDGLFHANNEARLILAGFKGARKFCAISELSELLTRMSPVDVIEHINSTFKPTRYAAWRERNLSKVRENEKTAERRKAKAEHIKRKRKAEKAIKKLEKDLKKN